jgi:photosystem II stability/assembly factor-like uncharacterized protein
MKAGRLAMNQGNPTRIRIPDPNQYGQFLTIGIIPGDPDLPEIPVTRRYTTDLSFLMGVANTQCDIDAQIHIGACKNPQDFNRGWQKIVVLEAAHVQRYGTSDAMGALEPRDRVIVNEEATLQGENMYEIVPLILTETAQVTVTREIVDVAICDQIQCGTCGVTSDGCQNVFMLSLTGGGSPGAAADVIYTSNGGGVWGKTHVSSLGLVSPDAMACVGDNLVVVAHNDAAPSLNYAPIADILNAVETWTQVTSGLVVNKGPTCIFAASPNAVFIGGKAGYIYHTTDPTNGVSVQTNGAITSQDFTAIHGLDDQHVAIVGKSNTFLITNDGGTTWQSLTGPSAGNDLSAVCMITNLIIWVGDINGGLFYTMDGGNHWTARSYPGQVSGGALRDIVFPTRTVGFLSADTLAPVGRLYRTVDGGGHWYLMPEGPGSIPANQRVKSIVACNVNHVFGGGLASNGTDGFAVIAAV